MARYVSLAVALAILIGAVAATLTAAPSAIFIQ